LFQFEGYRCGILPDSFVTLLQLKRNRGNGLRHIAMLLKHRSKIRLGCGLLITGHSEHISAFGTPDLDTLVLDLCII